MFCMSPCFISGKDGFFVIGAAFMMTHSFDLGNLFAVGSFL